MGGARLERVGRDLEGRLDAGPPGKTGLVRDAFGGGEGADTTADMGGTALAEDRRHSCLVGVGLGPGLET